jgi:hypothetical protein
MGGIIGHSSNQPDHVALSSAEAGYNQACFALLTKTHANMILDNLMQQESSSSISLCMNSKSGVALGSFKDTVEMYLLYSGIC